MKTGTIKSLLPLLMMVLICRDENGYYQITGRVDDVINVTGHRLGTAEVEDIMVSEARFLHSFLRGCQ